MYFQRTRAKKEFWGRRPIIRRIFSVGEKRNLMNISHTTLLTKKRT